MKLIRSPEEFLNKSADSALTIGNFDGVHLGHKAVLTRLLALKKHTVVLTFSNHPATVLHRKNVPWITDVDHRLALLQQTGIDTVILMPFTSSLAAQTPELFLSHLKKCLSFSYLILGHDAVLGQGRTGGRQLLSKLSEKLRFSLEYLDPISSQGSVISSSRIRHLLELGDLKMVQNYLGRPFSIKKPVISGAKRGTKLGFQTANLDVERLALPPNGVYIVSVKISEFSESLPALANLGHGPTLHKQRKTILEVHILDFKELLYDKVIEVQFLKYLRPEKTFESVEDLQTAISQDVLCARAFFFSKKASVED